MEYRHIRRTRVVVAVAIGVIVVATSWSYVRHWQRSRSDKPVVPNILPSNAENATVGFNYTKIESGRTIYSIKAWRNLGLKDNKNILEDVEVLVYGKTGDRYDRIHSARADYDQDAGTVTFNGDVTLLLSSKDQELKNVPRTGNGGASGAANPTQIRSSMVTYSQRSNRVDTAAPVQFVLNEVSGSAIGMHYDANANTLILDRDVQVVINRQNGTPPIEITGSSMNYRKATRSITFSAPAELRRGNDRLKSQEMIVYMDENNHAHEAVARGNPVLNASTETMKYELTCDQMTANLDPTGKMLLNIVAEQNVKGMSRSESSTTEISAQRLIVSFQGNRNELKNMVGEDNVFVKMTPRPGAAAQVVASKGPAAAQTSLASSTDVKTLRSSRVEITMRPGGREIQTLVSPRPSTLEIIPSDPGQDKRTITADRFDATFGGARNTLESFRAAQHVNVDLEPTSAAPSSTHRKTSSDNLVAAFSPSTGELLTLEQAGHFHFSETAPQNAKSVPPGSIWREAVSNKAHYTASSRITTLEGNPEVWDASGRTSAAKMLMDETADLMTATGNVKTIYQNKTATTATPFSGNDSPVLVSADKLLGHSKARTAVYSGNVRMWQDENAIKADEIHLDQNAKTLLAEHHVVSTFLNQQANASKSGNDKKDFVTITAETLRYDDNRHMARYDRDVVMRGDSGVVRSPALEIHMAQNPKPSESRIDHATALGGVTITQPDRRATAERADFYSSDNRIVLTGNQPTIIDNVKGATTGRELTFYTRDDRVLVDGDPQGRTTTQHKMIRQ
ncbi:MAG: LptA/OstA family protein [Acidobacteriia bacterium]|nr:LptA/OstA family protein [Terriglobia bacterium]